MPPTHRSAVFVLRLAFVVAFCLLATSCSRGPQTAAELFDRMPRGYGGELRLQGETGTRTLRVEILDLAVRDEHHLGFGRIAYQVSGGDEGAQRGEVPMRGTISAPGGTIEIEDPGNGDALKAGSFEGKLAADLESVEAKWKTGYGQAVGFQGKAAR